MKELKFYYLFSLLILLNVSDSQGLFSASPANDATKKMFEQKYSAWKKELEITKDFLGDPSGYDLKSYHAIAALGIPGLPFIISKLQEEPVLFSATLEITKRRWYWDEDKRPTSKLLLSWWSAGQNQVQKDFEFRYGEWIKIKSSRKEAEIAETVKSFPIYITGYPTTPRKETEITYALKRFEDLGIAALPYMFEKITLGETEFIPVVSHLTDGTLKADVSVKDCVEWWKKNKNQWLIPFPDQNLWDK